MYVMRVHRRISKHRFSPTVRHHVPTASKGRFWSVTACGRELRNADSESFLQETSDASAVSCGVCRRTRAYREEVA